MTPDPDRRSVTASVLFLHWRDAAPAAGAPAPHDGQLRAMAAAAIQGWDAAARVVLEAPQGLAIVAMVPAVLALEGAGRAAGADPERRVAIALHRGAVEAIPDAASEARVHGEGVATAAALASAAGQHQVLASQAFRDALALQSPQDVARLEPAGDRAAEALTGRPVYAWHPALGRRRALLRNLLGVAGLGAVLGAGLWGRQAREEYEAARRPAILELDIRPWGEVTVDGESKGRSPPLVKLSLAPGPHLLEIENGRSRPLRMELQVQPGEMLAVKHVFAPPPAPASPPRRSRQQPGLLDRFKFW